MRRRLIILLLLVLTALLGLYLSSIWRGVSSPRSQDFIRWWRGTAQERAQLITVQRDSCPGAPFILPADGYIGLLYEDPRGPYSTGNPHQGIDIFSNSEPGVTPVYAAYDGYLTRESTWHSSIIVRVPQDPFQPEDQIWLYYTHMADASGNDYIDEAFPPGTREKFVPQGTLLGYTGDYNGRSLRDIWVHLHFSIVKDDGSGNYANELQIENTKDPSPYLGMQLNYTCSRAVAGCTSNTDCSPH